MTKGSKYNVPNSEIAQILDKSLRSISRYRLEGMPDTRRKSSLRKFLKEKKKNKIKKLAIDLGIPLQKCYSYLKQNMPENFLNALEWIYAYESVETYRSLARKLHLDEKQIRILVKEEGMPFNESLFPVEDAREWIEKRNFRKNQKLTKKQYCKIIGISEFKYDDWIFKNPPLPSVDVINDKKQKENIQDALRWMMIFTINTGNKIIFNENAIQHYQSK